MVHDLIIVGGGPAGLSAAINGASEGLSVLLLDGGSTLGGQAKESSAIENYPGFPEGITGADLMGRMGRQARKFASAVVAPSMAASLLSGPDGLVVQTDDYEKFTGRAVLLSLGLSYRRMQAENIGHFMGRGVSYGVPAWKPANGVKTVAVIGGANSAGQAVLGLAKNTRLDVKLLVRKQLSSQMSTYLIERILATHNIEVVEFCEVHECRGDERLTHVCGQRAGDGDFTLAVDQLCIFIGAIPKTMWLRGVVECDENNFIIAGKPGRLAYETSLPGCFVAGDVRSGSIKRIATSIGEGAGALQMIHQYLAKE